jgi:hypothetical protein
VRQHFRGAPSGIVVGSRDVAVGADAEKNEGGAGLHFRHFALLRQEVPGFTAYREKCAGSPNAVSGEVSCNGGSGTKNALVVIYYPFRQLIML